MRLIDADAVKFNFQYGYYDNGVLLVPYRDAKKMIEAAKTVDAVPVVRCRECKHHHDCGTRFCDALGMDCPDDSEFFCSYGERKEGAD